MINIGMLMDLMKNFLNKVIKTLAVNSNNNISDGGENVGSMEESDLAEDVHTVHM